MNATQLLAHFDRLSEAPGAVPRLRRFILDLAVRGKLVEQDAGDEPAVALLTRIHAEKARLVKAGKLKRVVESTADEFEAPFVLPNPWVWARLGDVAQYGISDKADSNAALPENTWVLDLEDIEKGTSRLLARVELSARPFSSTKTVFKQGDVLFGKLRPYLNKVVVADRDGVCTTEIIPIRGYCGLVPEYTELVLRSPLTMARVDRLMYGVKMPRLGTADATALSYPLPPLAEQHRIVAKVDELMALCDQLEAAQQERERRRDLLSSASLQRLNQSATDTAPATQREHARFHLHHLPHLTTRPEHIKALRKAILNLAVRGRLVLQDDIDVPASKALVTVSKLFDAAESFAIPASWTWRTVGDIAETRLGKMLDKAKNKGTLRRYLRNVNVRWFDFDLSDVYEMRFEDAELDEFSLRRGDVLICEGGEPGRVAVWDERESDIYFQKAIHRVRFPADVNPHYFANVLREAADSKRLETYFTGVGIKHFTGRGLASFLVPLPPLPEQHRIVAKVDELMALCDQLEAQLTTTQTDSRRLLEAVLDAALMPA